MLQRERASEIFNLSNLMLFRNFAECMFRLRNRFANVFRRKIKYPLMIKILNEICNVIITGSLRLFLAGPARSFTASGD
ncbi:MAG: hypothetical protein CMM47_04605 [Rhodospirillaceae bacterium]|nr:hypothetical protein [Rhodospirillaceae bacterium]